MRQVISPESQVHGNSIIYYVDASDSSKRCVCPEYMSGAYAVHVPIQTDSETGERFIEIEDVAAVDGLEALLSGEPLPESGMFSYGHPGLGAYAKHDWVPVEFTGQPGGTGPRRPKLPESYDPNAPRTPRRDDPGRRDPAYFNPADPRPSLETGPGGGKPIPPEGGGFGTYDPNNPDDPRNRGGYDPNVRRGPEPPRR